MPLSHTQVVSGQPPSSGVAVREWRTTGLAAAGGGCGGPLFEDEHVGMLVGKKYNSRMYLGQVVAVDNATISDGKVSRKLAVRSCLPACACVCDTPEGIYACDEMVRK